MKRENLEQRMQEELSLDLPAEHPQYAQMMAGGDVARIDTNEAARQIDVLRDAIKKLGSVNLASPRLELLSPIEHRDDVLQADLAVFPSRSTLVSVLTQLINTIRGVVKSFGSRLRSCSTPCFRRLKGEIPSELAPALDPLFDQLALLTKQIRAFDRTIERIQQERYPEVDVMLKVCGVGALTAMASAWSWQTPRDSSAAAMPPPTSGFVQSSTSRARSGRSSASPRRVIDS